jgi:hypothetical protein
VAKDIPCCVCNGLEFQYLYSSPNIIKVIKLGEMRLMGHIAQMGEIRNAYKIIVRNSEGKKLFGRSGCRWG